MLLGLLKLLARRSWSLSGKARLKVPCLNISFASVKLNPVCIGAATLVYAATADELEELGKGAVKDSRGGGLKGNVKD